ncbi:MAG TPA: CHAD domain-containing protein [Rubrivivax sp.]|nr:CHAD domain-containing protein [Rubrivivax sp.]
MAVVVLRFQVPHASRAAVRRAMVTATRPRRNLRTVLFDTAHDHLAAQGLTLQLREDGRSWSQVLARSVAGGRPVEDVVAVPSPARGLPVLDADRHAGSPWWASKPPTIEMAAAALRMRGHVQVKRACRAVRSGASRIRINFDEGHVQVAAQRWPVCELAFEPLTGPLAGLVTVASRWIERHGLWYGASTSLALPDAPTGTLGQFHATRVPGRALSAQLHPEEALAAMVGNCLEQLMPNVELVAAGVGEPVHLHQTRVALRRLRTALRVFGPWSPSLDPRWNVELRDIFQRLGAARDSDAVAAALSPQLVAAGAPLAQLPKGRRVESPTQILRHSTFNRLLTELIAFCSRQPDARQGAGEPISQQRRGQTLKRRSRTVLKRLHRQVMNDAPRFLTTDDATRHRTRKRLKRLRYSVEFLAPLFGDKTVARYLKSLRLVLDSLGALNDLTIADALFRAQLAKDARAWFAVGWIAARKADSLQECSSALGALSRVRRFWEA